MDKQGNWYFIDSPTQPGAPLTANAFQKTFKAGTCGSTYTPGPHGGPGFSTPIPCRHGYIQRLSADGSTLLAGTYFGGSVDDSLGAIALDSSGNIYVIGGTRSTDLPVTPQAYQSTPGPVFLAVLTPDGSRLLYCTYLNFGGTILVDQANRVLLVGTTQAPDFPVTVAPTSNNDSGRFDAFIARLDLTVPKLDYAVRFGGSMDEFATGAALDGAGNLYVTGLTSSTPRNAAYSKIQPATNFPITPGAYQKLIGGSTTFIAKFDPFGAVIFSSAFGGSSLDRPTTFALDAAGNAYVAGTTSSTDFPVTPGAFRSIYSEGFATKLSADGSTLLYSTFLGASEPRYAAVSAAGEFLLVGDFGPYTSNFPAKPDAVQPCLSAADTQLSRGAPYFLELSPNGTSAGRATFIPDPPGINIFTRGMFAVDSNARVLLKSLNKFFEAFNAHSSPGPGITCIANAATYRQGPIAPGEIVTIFGSAVGPIQPAFLQIANGAVGTSLGGVRVLFNGVPAPLLYVSENQINAVVPFEVAGQQQCSVELVNQDVRFPPVTVPVVEASVGIFTLDSSGAGPAAVLNRDGTVNDYAHPAPRGSIVSVFVTGAGAMQPKVPNGSLGTGKTIPVQQISGDLVGFQSEVLYVGDAPGLVQGVVQINLRVPANLYETGYVRLDIRFGPWDPDAPRQAAVYLTVK